MNIINNYTLFILYLLAIVISEKRYIFFLPTIPVYPNNYCDTKKVSNMINERTMDDISFFELTDPSISHAFANIVPSYSIYELDSMITELHVKSIIIFFKYSINRARPKQIDESLDVLESTTAHTPAFPAGHAFQAYYLAKILGRKMPDKQFILDETAKMCDICRIKAGLHYPSDGIFSKNLVDYFFK